MFISFSNGTGSAFENSLESGYPFASVSARLKTTLLDVLAETGRDLIFGTTARLSDLSMSLTGEVRRSPEPSARPSTAADSEER